MADGATTTLPAEEGARVDDSACSRFEALWQTGRPPDIESLLPTHEPARSTLAAELACLDLEYRLRSGRPATVEEYLSRFPALAARPTVVRRLARLEYQVRRHLGEPVTATEYRDRFPGLNPSWAADLDPSSTHDHLPVDPAGNTTVRVAVVPVVTDHDATLPVDSPISTGGRDDGPLPELPGFEVSRVLGRGGMGVVFQAWQQRLNRQVAVKMIARMDGSVERRVRFLIEAEAVAALRHENVVTLYEFGESAGQLYLVLEYVSGGSVQDVLLKSGPFPQRRAAEMVAGVAAAVAAAHEKGIIHRDVKPANVLVAADGGVKLTDFGMARKVDSGLTATGAMLGTPQYMAPEQAAGDGTAVGTAADVWGLGGLLYACLTGVPPFGGGSIAEVLKRVADENPVSPRTRVPNVHRDLEVICLKCLEKTPARRYPSAAAVADDLRRWLAGEAISARPPGRTERVVRWVRKRPTAAALYAVVAVTLVGGAVAWDAVRRQTAETARRAEAEALVRQLATADTPKVPAILAEFRRFPAEVGPLLADRAAKATDPREQLHVALARLPADPSLAGDVSERLLTADPSAVPVIVAALVNSGTTPTDALWAAAKGDDPGRAVRAAAALAQLAADDARWAAVAPEVGKRLTRLDPLTQAAVIPLLKPIQTKLVPPLLDAYRAARRNLARGEAGANESADRAEWAETAETTSTLLVMLTTDHPAALAAVATELESRRHHVLYPLLNARRDEAAAGFRDVLKKLGTDPSQAKRQAVAAGWLLRLGAAEDAWPLFRLDQDVPPDRRSYVIHATADLRVEPTVLAERYLTEHPDLTARRALALALGDFPPARLPDETRTRLIAHLTDEYRTHPDPGLHAAAGWGLRRWGQTAAVGQVDSTPLAYTPDRGWFVNRHGQTFAVVAGPVDFRMGAPAGEGGAVETEWEVPHPVRIPRSFAIGLTEVTAGQLKRLVTPDERMAAFAPTDDHPAVFVSWYLAAEYCNKLSRVEHFQECYLPNKAGQYASGMRMKPDYLSLTGYRLPTEAEWECACRAGTTTARHFGNSADLLDRYGVYTRNSLDGHPRPVGSLKPNDLGLSDMYGNALEWVANLIHRPTAGKLVIDLPTDLEVLDPVGTEDATRVGRGGEHESPPQYLRSAYRNAYPPSSRTTTTGFRLARTIATEPTKPPPSGK